MFIGIHPVEKSQDNTVGNYIDPDCNETFFKTGSTFKCCNVSAFNFTSPQSLYFLVALNMYILIL